MTETLIDSNVLLDVLTNDLNWFDWSAAKLSECADQGELVINPIIYAEISTYFPQAEALDALLSPERFRRDPLPYTAGFLAGQAFLAYRRRGGTRRSPLPDFYIGAHALVSKFRLLTRDDTRYRTYFPGLQIIAPA